ncbi:MAG: hypothetical protein HY269_02110 [Deltaproteobacteria bacterium]|nr:hypothetical protein [Deltaproteobacteria bacterium]
MRKLLLLLLPLCLLLLLSARLRPLNLAAFSAPAGERLTVNDPNAPVLPNGRVLTPRGRHIKIAAHPYGLVLSPDGKTLAASCNGTEPFAVSLISDLTSRTPALAQIVADRERYRGSKASEDAEDEEFRSVFMGVAIAPDNRTLYAASGNQGSVFVFDLQERKRIATIKLNDQQYRDSFLGALVLTRDGRRLYVLDQANYRVATVDPQQRTVIESQPTGRAPFSLALSPDERKLYVTNVGLFRYALVAGYDAKDPLRTGLSFPPFGFPSEQARAGVTVEGKRVPGLGDPNAVEAASLWAYEVGSEGRLRVIAKTKTGRLIGATANGIQVIGSSSPSGVVAGRNHVFVSNANNDSVTVLDAANNKVVANLELNLFDEACASKEKISDDDVTRSVNNFHKL